MLDARLKQRLDVLAVMTGDEFKSIYKGLNLTQTEMAEKLGVSRGTISDWSRGAVVIDRRTALAARQVQRDITGS